MNKCRDKLDLILDGESGADFVGRNALYGHRTKNQREKNIKNDVGLEIKTRLDKRNMLETLGEIRHSKETKYKNHEEMGKRQTSEKRAEKSAAEMRIKPKLSGSF